MERQKAPLALSDDALQALEEKRLSLTIRAMTLKNHAIWSREDDEGWPIYEDDGEWFRVDPPYGPVGSYLWVREQYRVTDSGEVEYRRDLDPDKTSPNNSWSPIVTMPEKYARYRLKITGDDFRKGVQEITTEEMKAMGFGGLTPRKTFLAYWNMRYRSKLLRWQSNPAVWIARFTVQRRKNKKKESAPPSNTDIQY